MKTFARFLFAAAWVCCASAAPLTAATPSFHTSPRASVIVSGGSMMAGNQFAPSTLAAMREHYAGCRQIALVLHASHPTERDRMEARLRHAFEHLVGAKAESLHRHDAEGQMRVLAQADGIFVGGGETFVLLGELQRSGQLELIRERVRAGVPYGGSSAGANVAGLIIGTTNDFPVAEIATREALGVFPAVINPHHPPPETDADFKGRAGKIAIYLQFNPTETVLALANASLARLHDGRVTLVAGRGWLYRAGSSRALQAGDAVPEISPKP